MEVGARSDRRCRPGWICSHAAALAQRRPSTGRAAPQPMASEPDERHPATIASHARRAERRVGDVVHLRRRRSRPAAVAGVAGLDDGAARVGPGVDGGVAGRAGVVVAGGADARRRRQPGDVDAASAHARLPDAARRGGRADAAGVDVAGLAVAHVLRQEVVGEAWRRAFWKPSTVSVPGATRLLRSAYPSRRRPKWMPWSQDGEVDGLARASGSTVTTQAVGRAVAVGVLAGLPAGRAAAALRGRRARDPLGADAEVDRASRVAVRALAADALARAAVCLHVDVAAVAGGVGDDLARPERRGGADGEVDDRVRRARNVAPAR